MPMAMIVTRNVEARYRGFLASVMLEVAPGVYIAPDLSAAVRKRVWDVLSDWWSFLQTGVDCDGLARRAGLSGTSASRRWARHPKRLSTLKAYFW